MGFPHYVRHNRAENEVYSLCLNTIKHYYRSSRTKSKTSYLRLEKIGNAHDKRRKIVSVQTKIIEGKRRCVENRCKINSKSVLPIYYDGNQSKQCGGRGVRQTQYLLLKNIWKDFKNRYFVKVMSHI